MLERLFLVTFIVELLFRACSALGIISGEVPHDNRSWLTVWLPGPKHCTHLPRKISGLMHKTTVKAYVW